MPTFLCQFNSSIVLCEALRTYINLRNTNTILIDYNISSKMHV